MRSQPDLQSRRSLRVDLAVRRSGRPPRQSGRRAGLHGGGTGAGRADRSVSRRVSRRARSTPTPTTSRRGSGMAWRIKPGTILRGRLRRELQLRLLSDDRASARRAAAVCRQRHRHRRPRRTARSCRRVRRTSQPDSTTNTFGVDPTYDARPRADLERRRLARLADRTGTSAAATPGHTGSSLDIVRAPNRDPAGLRIEGVQPFLWQTSEGASVLNAVSLPAATPVRPRDRRRTSATRSLDRATMRRRSAAGAPSWRRTIRIWPPSGASRASTGVSSSRPTSQPSCRSAPTAGGCTTAACGRTLLGDWRASADVHLAVGHAAHAAGRRRCLRRRARHQRDAARRLQRRARSRSANPTIDRVLQHRGVLRAAGRHVRHGGPQHHHRPGQPPR